MNRLATVSANGRSLAPVDKSTSASLVLLTDPHSASAEAYRSLAANLQFAYADRQLQTIGVTSAAQGEGKSTTVANLAVALAQMKQRVGLLDGDIHGPNVPQMMGLMGEQPFAFGEQIFPLSAHGVTLMSMGFRIERARASP